MAKLSALDSLDSVFNDLATVAPERAVRVVLGQLGFDSDKELFRHWWGVMESEDAGVLRAFAKEFREELRAVKKEKRGKVDAKGGSADGLNAFVVVDNVRHGDDEKHGGEIFTVDKTAPVFASRARALAFVARRVKGSKGGGPYYFAKDRAFVLELPRASVSFLQ